MFTETTTTTHLDTQFLRRAINSYVNSIKQNVYYASGTQAVDAVFENEIKLAEDTLAKLGEL